LRQEALRQETLRQETLRQEALRQEILRRRFVLRPCFEPPAADAEFGSTSILHDGLLAHNEMIFSITCLDDKNVSLPIL